MNTVKLAVVGTVIAFAAIVGAWWSVGHNAATLAQPSRVNPYFFLVSNDKDAANAMANVAAKVGFKVDVPNSVPDPRLRLRAVGAQMGPQGDLTPIARRRAVLDYYESSFDPRASDLLSYKGLRMQVIEFASQLIPDSRAVRADIAVAGFDAFSVIDRTSGPTRGATYFLSSKERSFQVTIWDTSGTTQAIPDLAAVEPFLQSLAASVK